MWYVFSGGEQGETIISQREIPLTFENYIQFGAGAHINTRKKTSYIKVCHHIGYQIKRTAESSNLPDIYFQLSHKFPGPKTNLNRIKL